MISLIANAQSIVLNLSSVGSNQQLLNTQVFRSFAVALRQGFEKLLSQIGSFAPQSVQKVYWSCNDRNSLSGRNLDSA